ncbi:MAG: hypothetical protein E6J63_18920 [Deltaproteobacteria bacterium]|nr:MAG: hypothetical protein E6J63_18920 [Deltaproteobacteria bacterium]
MEHLPVKDYGTLANALGLGRAPGVPGPGIASTVTFEVHWRHVLKAQHVRDATVGFEGLFKQTGAHIDWSMRNAAGFRFETNPSNQTTVAALLGRERNGVFFD